MPISDKQHGPDGKAMSVSYPGAVVIAGSSCDSNNMAVGKKSLIYQMDFF